MTIHYLVLSPLFQIIDECILCVHGGLSPDIKTLDQIRTIERSQEIPHKGAFCDILYIDSLWFKTLSQLFFLQGRTFPLTQGMNSLATLVRAETLYKEDDALSSKPVMLIWAALIPATRWS